MDDEFLRKAKELGGAVLAHGRVRGRAPNAARQEGGVLALTERGLVFVLEDLFSAGAPTLIPHAEIGQLQRRDDIWGAEVTLDTPHGRWAFSRLDRSVADQLFGSTETGAIPRGGAPEPQEHAPAGDLVPARPRAPAEQAPSPDAAAAPQTPSAAPRLGPTPQLGPTPLATATPQLGPTPLATPNRPTPLATPNGATSRRLAVLVVGLALLGAAVHLWLGSIGESDSTEPDAEPADAAQARALPEATVAAEAKQDEAALAAAAPTLAAGKSGYLAGEPIDIHFEGFSGSRHDWITLVREGAPDDQYEEWHYLEGQRSGSLRFHGLEAGSYEARGYFDWPRGGFVVRQRARVLVLE